MPLGPKIGPSGGSHFFTLAYIGKTMKKSSCLKPHGLEPIYLIFVQIIHLGLEMGRPDGHMFYIGLYKGKPV